MRLAKLQLADGERRIGVLESDVVRLLDFKQADSYRTLADVLHAPDPMGLARYLIDPEAAPVALQNVTLEAPIDRQEVWAAGVTYKRSRAARMEESETGASHYDRVVLQESTRTDQVRNIVGRVSPAASRAGFHLRCRETTYRCQW